MKLFHITLELVVLDEGDPPTDLNELALWEMITNHNTHEIIRTVRRYIVGDQVTVAEPEPEPEPEPAEITFDIPKPRAAVAEVRGENLGHPMPPPVIEVKKKCKRNEQRVNALGVRVTRFTSWTYIKIAQHYEIGSMGTHKGKPCVWLTDPEREAVSGRVRELVAKRAAEKASATEAASTAVENGGAR